MDIDWKIIATMLALGLSIYNFRDNRRSRGLEKRTMVVNELSEAQLVMSRIDKTFNKIDSIDFRESPKAIKLIKEMNEQCEDMNNTLEKIFYKLMNEKNPSNHFLENLRPYIKSIILKGEEVYTDLLNVSELIEEAIEERPEIIIK